MTELRKNPQLGYWVMVSAHRQHRPQMPRDWCPFCPGSGQVPDHYQAYLYPNDFPHLMPQPPDPSYASGEFYRAEKAYGHCDVVLYSPDHQGSITQLSLDHLMKIFSLWKNRTIEMKGKEYVKYCYIFENKGDVIGVTMPHPHGQIYSYPYIPPRVALELENAREHFLRTGINLYDNIIQKEKEENSRIIHESGAFLLCTPFAGDYPYEIHLFCKEERLHLDGLSPQEAQDFMLQIQNAVKMYDALFGFQLPFMMAMHQAPVDGQDYKHYRLHVEFYPLHRAADRLKYNAGSETGAWAFTNPSSPEDKAAELREVRKRILT
ncbi:MAG: galactose-1-phosphate uridylyltransferase [Candidatus Omnitrophota bacterium]